MNNSGKKTIVEEVVEVKCLKDDILKVSGRYLNFWMSYKGFLIKWSTCQSRVQSPERVQL